MSRHLAGLGVALVLVAAACGGDGDREGSAFSTDELSSPQRTSWITNGGSTYNQRYSPLDEIDTSNVGELKGVWRTRLKGSGDAIKYSGEAQPIVHDGVIYVVTGADDVFAIDAESGDIEWEYRANLDQKITTVCCGWTSRGVAIGEGKVYVGQLDGKLVALDIDSGEVAWSTQVGDWRQGYTITSAPLYFDGRVVTGLSGGEFGIRGRVTAFDAETGKEVWRFYTVPGPGEVGHETWGNDAWKRGGAPVWQTPAVDPELGLMYFSTGNAAPDLDGKSRPGDNLFTASIVAIDAETGKHRWHFQQVHHDIWDYDAPSPVVLFDLDQGERTVKGLAQASKTGWLYLLDRETGKPLYGIDEKPVPQLALQKTAKTQPFPRTPPFVSHDITDAEFQSIVKLARQSANGKQPPKVTRSKGPFEPFLGNVHVITPGPAGGTNWPPSSYNPETQMVYVCASDSVAGYSFTKDAEYQAGKVYLGSVLTLTGFGASTGTFTAIDATSGRIAWQKKWDDPCYSGSTTTAGDVVFVGRNNGELEAYDARSGERLWGFQTGAGANSTASVFERDGKEYVAFYSAGNSLIGSTHGDSVWLFSLDGDLGPAPAPGSEQGTEHAGADEEADQGD